MVAALKRREEKKRKKKEKEKKKKRGGGGREQDRPAGVPYRQAAFPSQFGAAPAAGTINHVIIIS